MVGHEVFATASIGIALSATGYDRPEDFLRDADLAMYRPWLWCTWKLTSGGRLFQHPHLTDLIRTVLSDTGVAARHLALEITESTAMTNVLSNLATLNELSAMGIHISIDDFGTGYSSLAYLRRFPIHSVKIDQSFLANMTRDSEGAAIATAIISMAHSLNLAVIAEGVETDDQLMFLRSQRCDEVQGYMVSRPVPADALTQLLEEKRRLGAASWIPRSAQTA